MLAPFRQLGTDHPWPLFELVTDFDYQVMAHRVELAEPIDALRAPSTTSASRLVSSRTTT